MNKYVWCNEKILVLEKELTETTYKKLQEILVCTKNNFIYINSGMYLKVESLIETNNIIIGSNNISLRKVNLKPYRFDKMYIDQELIKDKLYQIIEIQWKKNYIYKVLFNTLKHHTLISWWEWQNM